MSKLKCNKQNCGYEWYKRSDKEPKRCPSCKSENWNTIKCPMCKCNTLKVSVANESELMPDEASEIQID